MQGIIVNIAILKKIIFQPIYLDCVLLEHTMRMLKDVLEGCCEET